MAIGSTSRLSVAYMPEATFGVTPVSGTTYALRITNSSLDYAVTKTMSAEINAYRSVSSMIPVSAKSQGSLDGEMQYAEYDRLIASVLQNPVGAYGTNGVGTTFTAAFTATTITASVAPAGASAFTTLKKGQWFNVLAPADANNNKLLRVSKTVAPTSTVITLDANTPAVVSASVPNTLVRTTRMTNGTTQSSFSIEVVANDLGEYHLLKGMTPSKMSLGLKQGSLTSVKFDFMGASAVHSTSTGLPSVPTASNTYDVHSASGGAQCVMYENGVPVATIVNLDLSYDNALRDQTALCSIYPVGVGSGNIVCELSADIYFSNGTLYDRFLANTNTEFMFSSIDASGNGYVVTLPNANIKSHTIPSGSKDADLVAKVTFTALRDASNADAALRQLIFIDRVGAAVTP